MGVEIIAEAGVSHCGDVNLALKLIDMAREVGANVVKFQTYCPEEAINPNHKDFNYLKSLALTHIDFLKLSRHCENVGIEFMSTPGDVGSLKFLVEECGVKRIKIGSDDLTYTPLIVEARKTGLPIILSTGMATIDEIWKVLDTHLHPSYTGWPKLTLLHCVSSYPCAPVDANLRAMRALEVFMTPVGYSDHCQGYMACIAAVAMGATVIEKHFELGNYPGPDHDVSIDCDALADMILNIRLVEMMLGSGVKAPCEAEKALMPLVRKREDGRKMA